MKTGLGVPNPNDELESEEFCTSNSGREIEKSNSVESRVGDLGSFLLPVRIESADAFRRYLGGDRNVTSCVQVSCCN